MNNKKGYSIYIACPISKYVRYGFDEEFLEVVNNIYIVLKNNFTNVYFPLYEENYGKDKVKGDGKNCVSKDLEEVNKADVIVAIPEDSMGVSVELGWGSVQNKQMLVFVDKKFHQSELVKNIDQISNTKIIKIDTSYGYKTQENNIINEVKKYFDLE